jgi:uncharacterized protein DUF5675
VNLTLQRDTFTDQSTMGEMLVDGQDECYTLELPKKDGLPGSCIPAGKYSVVLGRSPEFEASTDPWVLQYASAMPHIIDIPGRSLIMIHWLNDAQETRGCVGVGQTRSDNFIGNSRAAFAALYPKIADAVGGTGCTITVIG